MVIVLPLNDTITRLGNADIVFPPSRLKESYYCGMNIRVVNAYVTAEFAAELFPRKGNFVVGLNSSPNDHPAIYNNRMLCYSTKYSFFIRAFPVSRIWYIYHL